MRTLLMALLAASAVLGQNTHSWISGVGDDANPCERFAPCQTLAGALAVTNAGGLITLMDPAVVGTLTIDKSITIEGGGKIASIEVSSGAAIVINASSTDTVVIRNLQIIGNGAANTIGVDIQNAASVRIENCEFDRLTTAIRNTSGTSLATRLVFRDGSINQATTGYTQNQAFAGATFTGITLANLSNGVSVSAGAFSIADSTFSATANCASVSGSGRMRLLGNTLSNCTTGLAASNSSASLISNNRFLNSATHISQLNTALVYTGQNNVFIPAPTGVNLLNLTSVDGAIQTISFAAIPDQPMSGTPYNTNATSSSGLPVSLSSSTPTVCSASGTSIQLLRTGLCLVTASQTGSSAVLPAPLVTRSFNVIPGPAVILSFATQPTSGTARTPLASIRVQALDAFGNPNATFNQAISLAIASGTQGATFVCLGQAATVSGIASFDACQFDRPGTYTLVASSNGITSVTSIAIRIFEQFVPPEFSFNVSTLQLTATTGNLGSLASMLLFNTSDGTPFRFTTIPPWLRLEQRTSGNPSLIWLTPDASNLAPGNYSAQLIADMPAFSLRTAIDLRLTVLPCGVSLNPDRLVLRPNQLSAGILVGAERNCSWAPTTSASWVKLNPSVTGGTGSLSFTFEPNQTGQPRAATVTILNTQFTILQPAGL